MKTKKIEHILYLVTKGGNIESVQLSAELWSKVEEQVLLAAKCFDTNNDPFLKPEPLEALQELKSYWDFTYPFEPTLYCESCGVKTDDFENDQNHPFHLTNANIGGLLVFQCRCGATIRKKHFHRKFVIECTPKQLP